MTDSTPTAAGRHADGSLDARLERTSTGWVVRVPVYAEEVHVAKQAVVYDSVVVRRQEREDVARVDATVRRERLQVETDGALEVEDPGPTRRRRR